jgi:hypothetical protein
VSWGCWQGTETLPKSPGCAISWVSSFPLQTAPTGRAGSGGGLLHLPMHAMSVPLGLRSRAYGHLLWAGRRSAALIHRWRPSAPRTRPPTPSVAGALSPTNRVGRLATVPYAVSHRRTRRRERTVLRRSDGHLSGGVGSSSRSRTLGPGASRAVPPHHQGCGRSVTLVSWCPVLAAGRLPHRHCPERPARGATDCG